MSRQALHPGDKFGDCTVERSLGVGGMGSVYLVRSPDGAPYALKLLDPEMAKSDPDFKVRFMREAEFAMTLHHRNLIPVLDAGEDPELGACYILMSYMPGGSVKERVRAQGRFPVAEAVSIVARIAAALEVAHYHGVVHRDIKSDNILFDDDGTPRLGDLGVARFKEDARHVENTARGTIIGTPAYMAPEQMMDAHGIDARADIYSLGVVLFEMLTGRRPYEGSTAMELMAKAVKGEPLPDVRTAQPDIPEAVAHALALMTAPKPEDRPQTVRDVADLLVRALSEAGLGSAVQPGEGRKERERQNVGDAPETRAGAPFFRPGDEFRGYVVERQLGMGGLGTVWLARHQVLDTLFAVKILDPGIAEETPEYVERFVREAKLATKIRHPSLVAVHDAGYDAWKGVYFLVMDYVDGDTLRDAIAFGGAMPENEAVRIVLQTADVLAAAQRFGMVHRDLKPENIMLTKEGTVKLLDLGVAKISDGIDSLKTKANAVFGTPGYISPEQAVDASRVDMRADIYSLGVILFEMLSGRRPYTGDTPMEIMRQLLAPSPLPDVRTVRKDVSPKVAEVLARMCAKRPEDRLASPMAVMEEFARIGYSPSAASGTEFAAEADAGADSGPMEELISGLPNKPADASVTMDTQDEEIKAFVSRLKWRKRIRKLLFAALALALAAAIVLLFAKLWMGTDT